MPHAKALKMVIVVDGGLVRSVYTNRPFPQGDVYVLEMDDWIEGSDDQDKITVDFDADSKGGKWPTACIVAREDFFYDPGFVRQVSEKANALWEKQEKEKED